MHDLYLIEENEKFGFMNLKGEVVINPFFDEIVASYFSEGLCPFGLDGKYGFVDLEGTIEFLTEFTSINPFWEGLAAVASNGKWGYIDSKGDIAIPLKFDDACGFAEDNLATVEINGKWGYIGKSGEFKIPPTFDIAHDFDGPLAKIEIDDSFGYIDRDGRVVWMQTSCYK